MTTFVPDSVSPYKPTHPPDDDASRKLYADRQFKDLQQKISLLVTATQQLQGEVTNIWTALAALGHPRP